MLGWCENEEGMGITGSGVDLPGGGDGEFSSQLKKTSAAKLF